MPNTGMLDHRAYGSSRRVRSHVHWLEPWPSPAGYTTVQSARVAGFSRHLQQLRSSLNPGSQFSPSSIPGRLRSRPSSSIPNPSNSLSPFHTTMKPTCGYFFTRDTENRKCRIGIPPSNLVAWRSKFGHTHSHRAQTAH